LGIAKKVNFAFAGPQSLRVSQLLEDGQLEIVPKVALVCADQADAEGNLFFRIIRVSSRPFAVELCCLRFLLLNH
jgi:acyl CoA:acetate/3-ketoacid CoA transferase alpha subunit